MSIYDFVGGEDSEDDENIYITPKSNEVTTELVNKDNIMSFLLPDTIGECVAGFSDVCSSKETIDNISKYLKIPKDTPAKIIEKAKKITNCETERCVLKSSAVPGADHDLKYRFKIQGPTDTTLLTNVMIDTIMQQWGVIFPEFFPYNFNMKNFTEYCFRDGYVLHQPDTLATITFDLVYEKHKCCGCIINSDVYQGDGKHWMALFVDARSKVWTIEFFNSSGNSPAGEWVNWMMKTKDIMENIISEKKLKAKVKVVRVTSVRHQQSKSECGVYSLFYIWARINGVAYSYFSNPVPDQFMFEFRHHLFQTSTDKFDWLEYLKNTKIKWEQ